MKEEQLQSPRSTEVKKRSIEWSKLFKFGLDRKKKSMSHGTHTQVNRKKRQQDYLEDDYEDTGKTYRTLILTIKKGFILSSMDNFILKKNFQNRNGKICETKINWRQWKGS